MKLTTNKEINPLLSKAMRDAQRYPAHADTNPQIIMMAGLTVMATAMPIMAINLMAKAPLDSDWRLGLSRKF